MNFILHYQLTTTQPLKHVPAQRKPQKVKTVLGYTPNPLLKTLAKS
jgi:hypothetical protein